MPDRIFWIAVDLAFQGEVMRYSVPLVQGRVLLLGPAFSPASLEVYICRDPEYARPDFLDRGRSTHPSCKTPTRMDKLPLL